MTVREAVVKVGAGVGTALLGMVLVFAGWVTFLLFLNFIGYVGALVFGWLGAHLMIWIHRVVVFSACTMLLWFFLWVSYILGRSVVNIFCGKGTGIMFLKIWRAMPRPKDMRWYD
jgi:hypothetical protein